MAKTLQRGLSLPKRKTPNGNYYNNGNNRRRHSTPSRSSSSSKRRQRFVLLIIGVCTAVIIFFQFALLSLHIQIIDDNKPSSPNNNQNFLKSSYNIKEHDHKPLSSNLLSSSSSSSFNTTLARVQAVADANVDKQSQINQKSDRLATVFRQLSSKSSVRLPFEFQASVEGQRQQQSQSRRHKISLCVHLSTSKLDRFLYLVRRWGGPVSASMYITNVNEMAEFVTFYELYAHNGLQYTNFHLFMENLDGRPADDNSSSSSNNNNNDNAHDNDKEYYGYPYNILRNLAAENVDTEYLLSIDVDFMTQPDASIKLSAMLDANPQMVTDLQKNNVAMILPSFERLQNVTDTDIVHTIIGNLQGGENILPVTREQLGQMMDTNKIDIAHYQDYPPCQRATNFQRWFGKNEKSSSSSDGSNNNYYFIDYELQFEPYVILYKNAPPGLPKYFENFRGWGHDKSSFIMELAFSGFQFAVLKDWFLVHLEHKSFKPNNAKVVEERRQNLLEIHYKEFRHHLRDKFSWDDATYQMIFHKTKNIVGWNKINHPVMKAQQQEDVPILIGWKENNGRVYGRSYSKDWVHPLLIVTSLLVDDYSYYYDSGSNNTHSDEKKEKNDGRLLPLLKSNQVIRTTSGRSFFLSNATLEYRSSAKRNPIL